MKPGMNNLPITVSGQMLYSYFQPSAGQKVAIYGRIDVNLGESEEITVGPVDLSYVIDNSGSTTGFINELKQAVISSLDLLPIGSGLAVTNFNSFATNLVQMSPIEKARVIAEQKIGALFSDGGTMMGFGIETGLQQLASSKNQIKHLIVFTDGATADEDVCRQLVEKAKQQDIVPVIVGLCAKGVDMSYGFNSKFLEELGGEHYHFLEDPEKIKDIFEEEVKGAAATAIQNAKLQIQPVNWIEIQEAHTVLPNCVPASNPTEIAIGDLQVGQTNASLVKLQGILPAHVERLEKEKKALSFAKVTLLSADDQTLGSANLFLYFSRNPQQTDVANARVAELVKITMASKATQAAAQAAASGNVQQAKQELAKAKRLTQSFSSKDAAEALLAGLNEIEQDVDSGQAQRAAAKAGQLGRKTVSFDSKKAADALAALE